MATNPNEPNFPYGGGTDNPGDNTAIAGGPTGVASTETAPLLVGATRSQDPRFPPIVAGLAVNASDTNLGGLQAVPSSGAGFESGADYGEERSGDTGGVIYDPITGEVRVPGQDETAGETETTNDQSPSAFPEPNP